MRASSFLAAAAMLYGTVSFAQLDVTTETTLSDLSAALVDMGFPAIANTTAAITAADSLSSTKRSSVVCTAACTLLGVVLHKKVAFTGSRSYDSQQVDYWSVQQAEVAPACFVEPTEALDVSVTVLISEFTTCPFAVKGGGHACFVGASNIPDGITIDMGQMNTIEVSADNTITQMGAGNTWYDMYTALEKKNLAVVGGRVAAIGGGLTLGGGISFLSGLYGWACDNVENYELVTASGLVLDVNYKSYPDLYWALRGGGNNFGIVTRFDLNTYSQGPMWGGSVTYLSDDKTTPPAMFKAMVDFTAKTVTYPKAAMWLAMTYSATYGWLFSNEYVYTSPATTPPAAFSEFLAIPGSIQDTITSPVTLADLTLAANASNPAGLREHYTTGTFKSGSADFLLQLYRIWQTQILAVSNAANIVPAMIFQPIGINVLEQMTKNGGNALGLSAADGPFILMNMAVMWSDPADDARIKAATANVLSAGHALAKKLDVDTEYIYQNYASAGQPVFTGYGAANQKKLQSISKKYDPLQVFERLQPGYFKLST